MKFGRKYNLRSNKSISNELKGTYGSTLVIMSSNPEELKIVFDKLKSEYKTVMDVTVLDNNDYAMVLVRKEGDN